MASLSPNPQLGSPTSEGGLFTGRSDRSERSESEFEWKRDKGERGGIEEDIEMARVASVESNNTGSGIRVS